MAKVRFNIKNFLRILFLFGTLTLIGVVLSQRGIADDYISSVDKLKKIYKKIITIEREIASEKQYNIDKHRQAAILWENVGDWYINKVDKFRKSPYETRYEKVLARELKLKKEAEDEYRKSIQERIEFYAALIEFNPIQFGPPLSSAKVLAGSFLNIPYSELEKQIHLDAIDAYEYALIVDRRKEIYAEIDSDYQLHLAMERDSINSKNLDATDLFVDVDLKSGDIIKFYKRKENQSLCDSLLTALNPLVHQKIGIHLGNIALLGTSSNEKEMNEDKAIRELLFAIEAFNFENAVQESKAGGLTMENLIPWGKGDPKLLGSATRVELMDTYYTLAVLFSTKYERKIGWDGDGSKTKKYIELSETYACKSIWAATGQQSCNDISSKIKNAVFPTDYGQIFKLYFLYGRIMYLKNDNAGAKAFYSKLLIALPPIKNNPTSVVDMMNNSRRQRVLDNISLIEKESIQ